MYHRILDPNPLVSRKSLILLGPRQTGKSTLLKTANPHSLYFNLNDEKLYREWSARPELMRQQLGAVQHLLIHPVVIDEIQRLPNLLNEVQLAIDNDSRLRFILTGSSARKLKRGHANLLGGRAKFAELLPLVYPELASQTGGLRLQERITKGSLPSMIDSPDYKDELKSYVGGYLKEEIQAESLVRNIGNFSRFLEVAGLCNAEQINFTEVGNDCGVPPRTVKDFFTLLEDTLVGRILEPFSKTKKRKSVQTPKFYWFDIGVCNAICSRFDYGPATPEYGKAFETLVYLELRAWLSYRRRDEPLRFWRSQSRLEVDFTLGDQVALEVKAKSNVTEKDLSGLRALKEEGIFKRCIVVSLESLPRVTEDNIEILPIEHFLKSLWADEVLGTL